MSRLERLRFSVEEFIYRRRKPMYDIRCEVGLHRPGFWSDYYGAWETEPAEPYWHCVKCAAECYPMRFRVEEFIWGLPLFRHYEDWRGRRAYERECGKEDRR